MRSTSDLIQLALTSYALTFLFCLGVGSNSLGYFTSLYRPSKEKLNIFLDNLKFPFSIFEGPRNTILAHLLKVEMRKEQNRRITGSVMALGIHSIGFVYFASFKDTTQTIISLLWMFLYLVTHYSMWRFGSGLKSI